MLKQPKTKVLIPPFEVIQQIKFIHRICKMKKIKAILLSLLLICSSLFHSCGAIKNKERQFKNYTGILNVNETDSSFLAIKFLDGKVERIDCYINYTNPNQPKQIESQTVYFQRNGLLEGVLIDYVDSLAVLNSEESVSKDMINKIYFDSLGNLKNVLLMRDFKIIFKD
jgi:hypothetical protein